MRKCLKSFTHALRGLQHTLIQEQNFRIEIFCAIAVCGCATAFDVSKTEWFVILINIAAVLTAELFNTAIENLCNMIHKETHPVIRVVKDVSAAAVLVVAFSAFICSCIIFIHYFIKLIKEINE